MLAQRPRSRPNAGCAANRLQVLLLVSCALLLLTPHAALGQSVGRVEQTTADVNAYYRYVEAGAPTVLVHVLGAVQAPGMYELTDGTTLAQLLALTGGPSMGPRQRRNSRSVELRLIRPGNAGPIYAAPLDEALRDPSRYPALRDGDVLMVEVVERQGIGWRDLVQLANTAAIIILALDRLNN